MKAIKRAGGGAPTIDPWGGQGGLSQEGIFEPRPERSEGVIRAESCRLREQHRQIPRQDCVWQLGERRLVWLELRETGEEEGDEMGRWGESCRAVGTHSKLESRGGKQPDSGASKCHWDCLLEYGLRGQPVLPKLLLNPCPASLRTARPSIIILSPLLLPFLQMRTLRLRKCRKSKA